MLISLAFSPLRSFSSLRSPPDLQLTTTSVGLSAIQFHPSLLVLAADTFTAISYWSPTIQSTSGDWDHYASFGTNETVLVSGPYLVRNASISGSELSIVGDLKSTVPLVVYAPKAVEITSQSFALLDRFGALADLLFVLSDAFRAVSSRQVQREGRRGY